MQDQAALRALIPDLKTLPAAPRRIVLHWTGGGASANDVDKAHYHFIINRDGTVVKGVHPVAANMKSLSGKDRYAGHTGGFNSFSVGVSFSGMGSAASVLTEAQVLAGLRFVALLCEEYRLDPKNPAHLFTHMEAWTLHKVKGQMNHQKTDINKLAFQPKLKPSEVGPWLRERTAEYLAELR